MAINFSKLSYLQNITAQDIPNTHQKWLCSLTAPTIIDFTKENCERWRVVTTLLHGNEPSGFIALHQWIAEESYKNITVNIRFIICSIEAAQFEPFYSNRFLAGGKDINRCFGVKSLIDYYLRAELIASCIRQVKPEAIVDLHNTASSSPAFGVSMHGNTEHLSIASLFCDHVIVSNLSLGALMEQNFACSVLTIECGQSNDKNADTVAFNGIKKFCTIDELLTLGSADKVKAIYHPKRLEIIRTHDLTYSAHPCNCDVTLLDNIEQFNHDITPKSTQLGWVGSNGLDYFKIYDEEPNVNISDFFEIKDNKLLCKQNLQLFKATNKKHIAVHDCLFYFVPI